MSGEVEKCLVLLAVALVFLLVNLKAGYAWLKTLTFGVMVAALGGALVFAVGVVFDR